MSLEYESTNSTTNTTNICTPGGSSRALFGTPGSSGELLRSSSRGLSYYEPSGSSRILDGPAGSSRALLLTPLRDGPMLIGSFFPLHILFSKGAGAFHSAGQSKGG